MLLLVYKINNIRCCPLEMNNAIYINTILPPSFRNGFNCIKLYISYKKSLEKSIFISYSK